MLKIFLQGDAGVDARAVGLEDSGGKGGEVGFQKDHGPGSTEKVRVPLIANRAAPKGHDRLVRTGKTLADLVFELPEGQPSFFADQVVETPP